MAADFVRYDEDCGQEPFTLRLESAGEPTRCASDTSPAPVTVGVYPLELLLLDRYLWNSRRAKGSRR